MSLDKFALERALAYEHLSRWIDEYKNDYAESSEFADLKLARALVIEKQGDARFITPKEMQAALVLYNIVTIEACLETGEAEEIIDGITNLAHLSKSLKEHISTLAGLTNTELTTLNHYPSPPFLLTINDEILGRREEQYKIILNVIEALGYDRMLIPDRGKASIKKACHTNTKFFGSDDAFKGAWKDGRKLDLFKMANIEKYSKNT